MLNVKNYQMIWIDINFMPMPLETPIIIKHKYGVEAIEFHRAAWRYWYKGTEVDKHLLESITHWCKPE